MVAGVRQGIDKSQFTEWSNITRRALLGTLVGPDAADQSRTSFDLSRCTAATDSTGALCGTAYAFPTDLTVPGGTVPAAGVSAVGVLPTHRRQGHFARMMQTQLDDIAGRNEPVAVLVAAEYPIYRRYGYGPAADACGINLDAGALIGRPELWRDGPTGTVQLVDNQTFLEELPTLYDRARLRSPGHIAWNSHTYGVVAGVERPPEYEADRSSHAKVLWRDRAGHVQGAAVYTVEDTWQANRPQGRLTANPMITATDEAERELVRYLADIDWITHVRLDMRPVDDPLPLWLADGRLAAFVDRSDHIWVRILDVPAALTARTYASAATLVLEVDDPMGFAGGRFALTAGDATESGTYTATCTPTTAQADLTVPVSALGAAYLGGTTWARLAGGGWIDEHRPGAVATASALFTTPRAPWCARTF